MSFLDVRHVRRDDAAMVALHAILIRAYADKADALAIAGQVGILQADISVYPKMRLTWWSILEEAARAGQLRLLVRNAISDPTIGAWHDDLARSVESGNDRVAKLEAKTPEASSKDRGRHPVVGDKAPLWRTGSTLRVRFLDGDSTMQDAVKQASLEWLEYANLEFEFADDANAVIRISFEQAGSWAYVGTKCLEAPADAPNVNLRLDTNTAKSEIRQIVLHEFGHVLGLLHEHGNPESTIQWNTEEVYRDLGGPPNYWPREQVDRLFFTIWPPRHFPVLKIFDPESIMMYPVPDHYLLGAQKIGWNERLSPLDKQFIAALYPHRGA